MLLDYHLHNHFSPDSEEKTDRIIEKAISLGLNEICFSNHVETHDRKTGRSIFNFKEATKRFKAIKEELEIMQKDYPQIVIRFGAELEYGADHMEELATFVQQTPFDYILGSVHIVDEVIISSHLFADELYKKTNEETAYNTYFDNLMKLVEWGHFDMTAHFDICKKMGTKFYGPFKPEKYKSKIIPILERMKEKGIGLELNTKCMNDNCKEVFPHPTILKWALEVGIEYFSLGSDGHGKAQACEHIKEAREIAKKVGIKTLSTYQRRKPTKHAI